MKRKRALKEIKSVFFVIAGVLLLSSCGTSSNNESFQSGGADKIEILHHNATADQFAQYVHVEVKNNSDQLIQYVELKGVWKDASGNIVGTGIGNASNLPAGQTKTIDVTGLDIQNAATYDIEISQVL